MDNNNNENEDSNNKNSKSFIQKIKRTILRKRLIKLLKLIKR